MPEMCNLIHNDYDKITDKVMWLGFGVVLNFNIDLFFMKNNGTHEKTKENFHREYMYRVDSDSPYRVKIIRDFNYYFSIEYNTKEFKERVVIAPNNIYFLIFNLKKVMKWFIGDNGVNNIFKKNNGKLFIPTHPDPIRVNLAFGNYIEFEPAVSMYNGYETIGVKAYLNSDGIFFFMSSDTVFSLYHMLSTCNMYGLAQNMLNYIGRPPYGTNSCNLSETAINYNNKSFFDRVGAKSE